MELLPPSLQVVTLYRMEMLIAEIRHVDSDPQLEYVQLLENAFE